MRKFLSLSAVGMAVAFSSYGQLSGVKTINPAGSGPDNYASFTAAVNALKAAKTATGAAVNGTVTFNVTPGVYQERITIDSNATQGASAANQIIFQRDPSASPDAGGVFMRPATAGSSVINVYKASWVTLDRINLQDGDGGDGTKYTNRGMQLSGAQHCTFKNFTISMNSRGATTNVNSRGIATASSFGGAQYRPLKYNTFDNIRFVNISQRGVSLFCDTYGADSVYAVRDVGNKLINCQFDSIGSGYIVGTSSNSTYFNYFLRQDSLLVSNNTITNIIHTPNLPSTMMVFAISGTTKAPSRGLIIENNTIDGGADNVSENRIYGLYQWDSESIIRNNTITNISCTQAAGMYIDDAATSEIYNNKISNITASGSFAMGAAISDKVKFYGNEISNVSSYAASSDASGLQVVYAVDCQVYNNKIHDIYLADGADASAEVEGVILSAKPSDDVLPQGGSLLFYNNVVSGLYAYNADLESTSRLVRGVVTTTFTGEALSGGIQHIYHNTVVLNRPSALAGDVSHPLFAAALYVADTVGVSSLHFNNNIVIDRNTHAASDTSTSYLVIYYGEGSEAKIESNNYFGHDGVYKRLGAYYDTLQGKTLAYATLADWKAAGLDGAGYSDSTEVSFVDEAAGDFHLSAADYINPVLRAPRLYTVSVDFDNTARASNDTQKGADAQDGEVNLNPWSAKGNIAKAKSLSVFPSPATDVARFQMTVEKETAAQITVRNLMGQVVASKNVTLYAGDNTAGINVSGLASGLYVYNVNVNGQSYAGKFVK